MPKFRKKPVEIEARQFFWATMHSEGLMEWCGAILARAVRDDDERVVDAAMVIPTLEGDMLATQGDWIIKGVANEFYPCKPAIFEATYDLIGP